MLELYHRTLKSEFTQRILVPTSLDEFETELGLWCRWYNGFRPHSFLKGKTPDEAYCGHTAANTLPRIETRLKAKHGTPCASPRMMIAGRAGAKVRVELSFLEGRRHLPILRSTRV